MKSFGQILVKMVILSGICLFMSSETANAATGTNVNYHSQEEIREYILSKEIDLKEGISFQTEPVLTAPYGAGRLSNNTLQSALKTLNAIRYIAGIADNVTLNEEYISKSQAAALVNTANGQLSHNPAKPVGMSDELYALGAAGAASTNIAWSYNMNTGLNWTLVQSWMEDGDASNISRVGHRRWIINPSMGATGFGAVKKGVEMYSAVYAFDRSGTASSYYGVAWPAQNMPISYFGKNFPWSISMGKTVTESSVVVTLKRKRDNKTWSFSKASAAGPFYVDNGGYGQTGCIIFRPNDIDGYQDGDVFDVTITGTPDGTVSYSVNFFALDAVSSISLNNSQLTFKENGAAQTLIPTILPGNAENKNVTWSSSDETVAKVSSSGVVTPIAAGTAVITVTTESGGKTATCTVKVEHVEGSPATCSKDQVCTICGEILAAKTAHIYESAYVTDVVATCSTGGSRSRHCIYYSECQSKTDVESIPATGNHTIETAVTEPTCYSKGFTFRACTVCDYQVIDDETEMTAHVYEEGFTTDVEPTCTSAGEESRHCIYYDNCHSKSELRSIAAGHKIETAVTEPTCYSKGFTFRACTVCDYQVIDDETEMTAHVYEEGFTTDVEPTCTSSLEESRHCIYFDVCHSKIEERSKDIAAAHKMIETKVASTYTTKGYTLHKCTTCDYSYKDNYLPVLEDPASKLPAVGSVYTKNSMKFKVKSVSGENQLEFIGVLGSKVTKLKMLDSVNVDGHVLKVTSIAKNALKNNKKIKEITIGKNITKIGNSAFEGCGSLTKVIIGKNVKSIGKKAFFNCKKLKKIQINSSQLSKVDSKAFGKTHNKAVVKVPAKKLGTYKNMLKGKGLNKKAVINKK